MMFHKLTRTEEGWREYLDGYILGVEDHYGYLDLVGWQRLQQLKAKKPWGY
jgi:hypothetical protein